MPEPELISVYYIGDILDEWDEIGECELKNISFGDADRTLMTKERFLGFYPLDALSLEEQERVESIPDDAYIDLGC